MNDGILQHNYVGESLQQHAIIFFNAKVAHSYVIVVTRA